MLKNMPKDHISVSQITSYRICGRYYKYRYIDMYTPTNRCDVSGRIVGTAGHEYQKIKIDGGARNLEVIYFDVIKKNFHDIVRCQPGTDQEEVLAAFAEACLFAKYDDARRIIKDADPESAALYFDGYPETLKSGTVLRPSMFSIFLNLCDAADFEDEMKNIIVEAREKEMKYEFIRHGVEIPLLSYYDVIGQYMGQPVIIDWKFTKRKWGESKAPDIKDLIYSYIYWQLTGTIPGFWYIVFVWSPKTGNVQKQKIIVQHTEESLVS